MTPSQPTQAAASRWSIATFGVTILLSAFLLFQVQPLVSKSILPWFGGCPAVWTTCMLFFQTLLFGGYLYAHLLQRWLGPRNQAAVHLLLVVAASACCRSSRGRAEAGRQLESDLAHAAVARGDGGASLLRPFGHQPAGAGVVQ